MPVTEDVRQTHKCGHTKGRLQGSMNAGVAVACSWHNEIPCVYNMSCSWALCTTKFWHFATQAYDSMHTGMQWSTQKHTFAHTSCTDPYARARARTFTKKQTHVYSPISALLSLSRILTRTHTRNSRQSLSQHAD